MSLALLTTVHLCCTAALAAILWFVQRVHYPLIASVGDGERRAYAELHAQRTAWIVAPLMLVELGCAASLLACALRAGSPPLSTTAAGAGLLAVAWASTFLVQVPLHARLQARGELATVRALVASNWVRTSTWSARVPLACSLAAGAWSSDPALVRGLWP